MINLEKLEREIRGKIPILMYPMAGLKLSHGLEIVFDDSDGFCYAYDATIDKVKLYKASDLVANFEVIGHDVKLNDVLEWLNIKYKYGNHGINSNGQMIYWGKDEGQYIICTEEWDLSKPNLKNQSHDLINYLAGLI